MQKWIDGKLVILAVFLPMHIAIIALGSNIEPRLHFLRQAISELKALGKLMHVSSVYENEALGFESETMFYNAVLILQVDIPPVSLLKALKAIEQKIGRKHTMTKVPTSRCIDLDIIAYDTQVIISKQLIIPHPRFRERSFVLTPLVETYPEWRDPITQLTAQNLLSAIEQVEAMKRVEVL